MNLQTYVRAVEGAYETVYRRFLQRHNLPGIKAGVLASQVEVEPGSGYLCDRNRQEERKLTMSRISGKTHKKQTKMPQNQQAADNEYLKEEMQRQVDEEQYPDALATLAQLIKNKCYDPEMFYNGAYSYFMIGDYEKAITWINNVMEYEPSHIPAQILLSRLCIIEDRTEQALAVLDNMLSRFRPQLSENQQDEVYDITEYYGRTEAEHIEKNYPSIAVFLRDKTEEAMQTGNASPQGTAGSSPLAERPANEAEDEPESEQEEAPEVEAQVEEQITAVGQKQISLQEKIRLYNAFAGGYFFQHNYGAAIKFLHAAIEVDPGSEETLRNLAVLTYECGDHQKALQYAGSLPVTDFTLLASLR